MKKRQSNKQNQYNPVIHHLETLNVGAFSGLGRYKTFHYKIRNMFSYNSVLRYNLAQLRRRTKNYSKSSSSEILKISVYLLIHHLETLNVGAFSGLGRYRTFHDKIRNMFSYNAALRYNNAALRYNLAKLHRRTKSYSKSLEMLKISLALLTHHLEMLNVWSLWLSGPIQDISLQNQKYV